MSKPRFHQDQLWHRLSQWLCRSHQKAWSPDQIQSQWQTLWGKRHGLEEVFHVDGVALRETFWSFGKRHGWERRWTQAGELISEVLWQRDQRRFCRMFFDDGRLRSEIPYRKGMIEGTQISYHHNGEVALSTPYMEGVVEGVEKAFHTTRKLMRETPYRKGRRHGEERQYDDLGRLASVAIWQQGRLQLRHYYNSEGQVLHTEDSDRPQPDSKTVA